MLDSKEFRHKVKEYMGPVFENNGFRIVPGRDLLWRKTIDEDGLQLGIGFFYDKRNPNKPEFRFTLFVDPEDIRDIRAYRYSGWPPRGILHELGLRRPITTLTPLNNYDAWIPFPKGNVLTESVLRDYAEYLVGDLLGRMQKGRSWTKRTHRWEYK